MSAAWLDGSMTELAAAIAGKAVSAREVTDTYLARIDAYDGAIGSYLCIDREGARRTADEVDARLARGEAVGRLAGVPLGLKDILVTRGMQTTAASKMLAEWVPPYDGTVVARLRAEDAVILGKLNLDEFAMGSSNENSAFRPVKNPWDHDKVPGGSSGGSAAAVAARLCAASLGTDTGGSIRQPAAMCGVVGLKPTYGRVSRYGVIAFASSLDQVGPLARSVEDVALLTEVIAGFDPRDATSIDRPAPALVAAAAHGRAASLAGLRVGLPAEFFGDGIDADVRRAIDQAIAVLGDLGATLHEISLPHTKYALPTYYVIAPAEASSNLARYDGVRYGLRVADPGDDLLELYCKTRGAGFGAEVKRRIMLGTFALRSGYYDAYYAKAQKVRALIKRDFDRAFDEVDVICGPTTPTPAFSVGEKAADPVSMYLADVFTLSCNLAGLPGMSVPCGFSSGGLPIGLQLLGKPLDEASLVRVGAAYQGATAWHRETPAEEILS